MSDARYGERMPAANRRQPEVWGSTVSSYTASRRLNEPGHRSQVRVIGLARTRTEFARMLVAAGLGQGNGGDAVAGTVRHLTSQSGSVTRNVNEVAACAGDEPGTQVYVRALDASGPNDLTIPWPPQDTP